LIKIDRTGPRLLKRNKIDCFYALSIKAEEILVKHNHPHRRTTPGVVA